MLRTIKLVTQRCKNTQAAPIGFALAGWGTELLGAPAVFLIGGIGVIVLVLLGLSHPAIRNLD